MYIMKTIKLALLLLSLANANLIQAHAVVIHSSLNVNPVKPEQATQVELTFNSKVELNLSQIFLVSNGDNKVLVDTKPGNKPGRIIISLPPLTPGEYALQLKVFAADGHLSEDLVRFFVTPEIK